MKKMILYSLGLTFFTIIVGFLFVYGIFDFSSGKSELIGPTKEIDQQELHNQIVDNLHDLGNEAQAILGVYYNLDQDSLIEGLKNDLETLNIKFEKFKNYMGTIQLPEEKELIITAFETNYGIALENYVKTFNNMIEFFKTYSISEENLNSFRSEIEENYKTLVAAHNSYVEVLNENRKY